VPLREYLRILWKRGWIVVVMAVVTAASAIVFSKVQRPVYRSTIQLNVMPARIDLSLAQSIKWLMRNYAANIRSDRTLAEVINRTGQDMTPDMLRADVSVSSIESDFLIQIDVDSYDPAVAQLLAQRIADVFVEIKKTEMLDQDVRDRVNVEPTDAARPAYQQSPKTKINAMAGGVLGVLLGVLVVLGLEWLDSGIIRTPDDLERAAEVAVLGAIRE
jgi:capsular polysaccharide biosynthesis protein